MKMTKTSSGKIPYWTTIDLEWNVDDSFGIDVGYKLANILDSNQLSCMQNLRICIVSLKQLFCSNSTPFKSSKFNYSNFMFLNFPGLLWGSRTSATRSCIHGERIQMDGMTSPSLNFDFSDDAIEYKAWIGRYKGGIPEDPSTVTESLPSRSWSYFWSTWMRLMTRDTRHNDALSDIRHLTLVNLTTKDLFPSKSRLRSNYA